MLFGFEHYNRYLKLSGIAPCKRGRYYKNHPIRKREWVFGEDIIGQALRSKEPVIYHESSEDDSDFCGHKPSQLCNKSNEKDHKLIISVPLHYPPNDNGAVVGIISFATCSDNSGLYQLLDLDETFLDFHKFLLEYFDKEIVPVI